MSLEGSTTLSSTMNGGSTAKQTKEAQSKIIRTKRKENDLRRMLHSYDLTKADPTQVKRLAETFDDIGTRSSCPTHLIYSPKKLSLKMHDRQKPEYIKGLKDHAADKINYVERLELTKREFAEKIEKIKDLIETDVEDIDFLRQQMQAQKERIASHQDAPRAQERDAEAGMILPVTGYNNASQLNKRMVEKSLFQLVKRIMNKRAEVNDAIGENNKIKYVIDNLRRERHTFMQISGDMHEELSEIKASIKHDEEYTEQTNEERKELHKEINHARNEFDEMRRDAQAQLEEEEQKRLEEIRLEQIAKDADDNKRREERRRKREESKARRTKAREEHQKNHEAHMKSNRSNVFGGGDSSVMGDGDGSTTDTSNGGSSMHGGSSNALDGGGSSLLSIGPPGGVGASMVDVMNAGSDAMREMYTEWCSTWTKLLEGTNIRSKFIAELGGDNGDSSSSSSPINPAVKRRQSMRPGKLSLGGGMTPEQLETKMRNRLCYELRSNADSDFSQIRQVNELKNNRDALHMEIRELRAAMRQLEKGQREGGTFGADPGTVQLIKRLEQEVSKLERVVIGELDKYTQDLNAVDTFCDEITTCYLRTGAGGSQEDSGAAGDDGVEEETPAPDGAASSSPARRSSSGSLGNENDGNSKNENEKVKIPGGSGGDGESSTVLNSEVSKLKPQHYRALDNLRTIEQHVKNVIYLYAAQPLHLMHQGAQSGSGQLANSMSSSNSLLSPHQQALHQQKLALSPKEREAVIVSRLGDVSAISLTRSTEQKIPRVDIPEDMEGAFGFDPDAMDDKPFLRNEVNDQLQCQLARIKEEADARMSVTASLGTTNGSQQQSAISSSGLIDKSHKIRAEKVCCYFCVICFQHSPPPFYFLLRRRWWCMSRQPSPHPKKKKPSYHKPQDITLL